jgi:aspartyl-tRNA synthetase
MKPSSSFKRTHDCGSLKKDSVGNTVRLSGWIHRRRDHGGLIFIDLRDRFGITQLVFDPKISQDLLDKASKLRSEWVVTVEGKVQKRNDEQINSKILTGEIEIEAHSLDILSTSKNPPFSVSDETVEVNEELRLKYRFLDIRRGKIAKNLEVRHKGMLAARKFLDSQGFLEINTPILAKTTPEGARDFLVPSRIYPGNFYALPQSPQIFKQILMISGMDRYFQIAQCFRDEDLRADRQPEFTQIDMEMSFLKPEDLFEIIENLVKTIFWESLGVKIQTPFQRMPYREAVEKYGTDKPDLRFGMPLFRFDDIGAESQFTVFHEELRQKGVIKGFCIHKGAEFSRKEMESFIEFVKPLGMKGLAWIKKDANGLSSPILKFFSEELIEKMLHRAEVKTGDILILAAGAESTVNQALDHLRRHIAKKQNLTNPDHYKPLWVTDFPLFRLDDHGKLDSESHPFTSPNFEDFHLLDSDPLKVRAFAYDLVLNGYEIASGSQRIHDSSLQEKIFRLLRLSDSDIRAKFGFFIDALQYGTPPHLGIALGFDRVMMILTKTDNIREVIAFPKTQKGCDLMQQSPSPADLKQLEELSLQINEQSEIFWSS